MDWIALAQDRNRGRAFADALRNLRFHNWGNFLTVSFLGRTLLHGVSFFLVVLLLFTVTFVQGIYSYMLGTAYVSRVGSVTAVLWLQYISHDKRFVLNNIIIVLIIIIIISITVVGVNVIVHHCLYVPR